MIEGGRKAGDKDFKEKRKLKKKAAESRLKVLGEALGHVDDEDGVLVSYRPNKLYRLITFKKYFFILPKDLDY